MAFLSTMSIVGSGLTAQQLRLDVISENITNMNTTRTEGGGPYRRKVTTLESESGLTSFQDALARARGEIPVGARGGVRVTEVGEDPSELKLVYDPTHPDANDQGYIELPNVDLIKEITDGMAATQAYSASVTALNVIKQVAAKGLEIGK